MPRSPRPGERRWPTASAADPRATSRRRPSSTASPRVASGRARRRPSRREHPHGELGPAGARRARSRRCTGWRRRSRGSSSSRRGRRCCCAHTGDSRAYRLRDGVLTQQTRDDSYVQALVDRGLVAAADAASHPRRNLITASLSGGERDAAVVVEHRRSPATGGCCAATDSATMCRMPRSQRFSQADRTADEAAPRASLSHSRPAPATTSRSWCATSYSTTRARGDATSSVDARRLLRCGRGPLHGRPRVGLSGRQPATGWRTTITCASKTRGSGPSSFSIGCPSRTQYS